MPLVRLKSKVERKRNLEISINNVLRQNQGIRQALRKTANNFRQILPILLGVLLLMGLANVVIPKSYYRCIFTRSPLLDSLIGAIFGSILAGNPINSYIIGGELLQQGVGLVAVTTFLLSWVTVGIVQLPAESLMLGRKFAVIRNTLSFIMAVIIAFLTVFTLRLL